MLKMTEQTHRRPVVLTAGAVVLAAAILGAGGYGSDGNQALAAQTAVVQEEAVIEETVSAEAVELRQKLTDRTDEGSVLAGEILAKTIRQKEEEARAAKAEIEARQRELLRQQQEEQARKEAEEAAKRAEEEKRAARRISYTDEDYQILLKIVQAEAGICDDKGKILVADVIINRVLSKKFPNTIKGVVYAPSQFQPVSTGRIHSVKVSQSTIDCVNRALDGEDYSDGALYFMNRRASGKRSSWFDRNLNYLFAHDGHEFFK